MYACYGKAAHSVPFEGESLDRLTVLARLGSEEDRENEEAPLSRAGAPVADRQRRRRHARRRIGGCWRSPPAAGRRPGLRSRRTWRLSASRPRAMERWLESALEAWRRAPERCRDGAVGLLVRGGRGGPDPGVRVSPARSSRLSPSATTPRSAPIPRALGVHYDLDARLGKTPVAFTDFGRHPRRAGGRWVPAEPWVFATYEAGGFDNLVELLHETGHADPHRGDPHAPGLRHLARQRHLHRGPGRRPGARGLRAGVADGVPRGVGLRSATACARSTRGSSWTSRGPSSRCASTAIPRADPNDGVDRSHPPLPGDRPAPRAVLVGDARPARRRARAT